MKKLAALCALIFAGSCYAMTGNELHEAFQNKGTEGHAYSYVSGLIDASDVWNNVTMLNGGKPLIAHCIPEAALKKQAVEVVKSHLAASPGDRHKNALILTLQALKGAWPCKKP